MGWLLDTNVISQLAPGRLAHEGDFSQWMRRQSANLVLSVITITEVRAGIAKLQTKGSAQRADLLRAWLDRLVQHYGASILPVDGMVAGTAGDLAEQARAVGHAPGLADILIAATAKAYGYGLMTESTRHFAPLNCGVPLLDPFQDPLP